MSEKNKMTQESEALMAAVREMKRGGDLDGLIESGIAKIRQTVYEQAVEERRRWEQKADFPPSAM